MPQIVVAYGGVVSERAEPSDAAACRWIVASYPIPATAQLASAQVRAIGLEIAPRGKHIEPSMSDSRLTVDRAEFWVSDETLEHGKFSPESLGGGTVRMILTVPDPDAMFAKALAAGARQVVAVEEAYGWRLGRVVDPFGHHWEIGHPL